MPLVHNEQVKLTANALNTAAVGLVITGLIAPVIATTYGVPNYKFEPIANVRLLVWIFVALMLHLMARRVLTGLRDE